MTDSSKSWCVLFLGGLVMDLGYFFQGHLLYLHKIGLAFSLRLNLHIPVIAQYIFPLVCHIFRLLMAIIPIAYPMQPLSLRILNVYKNCRQFKGFSNSHFLLIQTVPSMLLKSRANNLEWTLCFLREKMRNRVGMIK